MAFEIPGESVGVLVAAADLDTRQFTAVQVNSSGQIAAVTGSAQVTFGILQDKPRAGQPANVMRSGVTKMVAGAAVTAGAEVMADATGRAITAATATNRVIGIALETATAPNQIIAVALCLQSQRVL